MHADYLNYQMKSIEHSHPNLIHSGTSLLLKYIPNVIQMLIDQIALNSISNDGEKAVSTQQKNTSQSTLRSVPK